MEAKIKEALKTSKFVNTGRGGGGGCINEGSVYSTDTGNVFVKRNSRAGARLMFDGELAGLNAILATNTIRVPKPYVVVDNPRGGAVLVMEYLDMSHLSKHDRKLGELLARLHLHNAMLGKEEAAKVSSVHRSDNESEDRLSYVSQFGFETTTCCGYIPLDNTWCSNWVEFYTRQRLNLQLQKIQSEYGDREALELWSHLQLRIPDFFKDVEIVPALLHGDLWSGNVAELPDEPVIFDPATFYGHSEFELSIARMFGGFSHGFYDAYHSLIPKAPGFEKRYQLYHLFHALNHWNHFGGGYRATSLSIMRKLTSK